MESSSTLKRTSVSYPSIQGPGNIPKFGKNSHTQGSGLVKVTLFPEQDRVDAHMNKVTVPICTITYKFNTEQIPSLLGDQSHPKLKIIVMSSWTTQGILCILVMGEEERKDGGKEVR